MVVPDLSEIVPKLYSLTAQPLTLTALHRACRAWGWRLVEEDAATGVARFDLTLELQLTADCGGTAGRRILHLALLYWTGEEEGTAGATGGRQPFDQVFKAALQQIVRCVGEPVDSGAYQYRHRPGWSYLFAVWRGERAFLVLQQDELDIVLGADLSIWLVEAQPGETLPGFPLEQFIAGRPG